MDIAVIGADGYVGSALCGALHRVPQHSVTGVTRENYAEMSGGTFDIVVNCAMPSGRFWAKNNPEKDFVETVTKTANLLYGWQYKKFIQISTVSARCQLDTVYGRHKAAAEALCNYGDNLIVRLGALYGGAMKKGVLVDMLAGKKVYVDGESRYSFVSVDVAAAWIAKNLHRSDIVEFGGKHAISLQDVARHLGKDTEFEGDLNHQDIVEPEADFPEARDVLGFLDLQKI